jgi:SAM-dependent methyltransferase
MTDDSARREFALERLASASTGRRLTRRADGRLGDDEGRIYAERDGIVDLLDVAALDEATRIEMMTFDHAPIQGVCYFSTTFLHDVLGFVLALAGREITTCVEVGGGEGYFASTFRSMVPGSAAYVCDLSEHQLRRADPGLIRVRCDVRRPYIVAGSVDLAAFWVSLHHLDLRSAARAVAEAQAALAPGGILLVFEPSAHFLPRRLLYRSPFARDVYFDVTERPVSYADVHRLTAPHGLALIGAVGVNPLYDGRFLRSFRLWPLYVAATAAFAALDLLRGGWARPWREGQPAALGWGGYLLALYRKPDQRSG